MDTNSVVDEAMKCSQKIMEVFHRDKVPPAVGQGACLAVCAASVAALRLPEDKAGMLALHHQMLDLLVAYCEEQIAHRGGMDHILATIPPQGSS